MAEQRSEAPPGVHPDARSTDYDAVAVSYEGGGHPELREPAALATSYLRGLFNERSGQPAEVSVVDSPAQDVPQYQELDFTVRIAKRPELTGTIGLERYRGGDGFWYVSGVVSDAFSPLDLDLEGSQFTGELVSSVAGRAQVRVQGIQSESLTRDETQEVAVHHSIVLDAEVEDSLGAFVDVSMETADGGLYLAVFTYG